MTVTTSPARVTPRPPYQLRARRRLAAVPLSFAWALTPFIYAALAPGPLALAVVVVVAFFTAASVACLLRPPTMVRLDDEGLVFDSRPLGWGEVDHLELCQTFMGLRLRAQGGGGPKPPRLFQVLLPAPLPEVLVEAHARAASPVTVIELPPTRAARYRRPAWAALALATVAFFVSFVPVPGATFSGPRDALPVGSRLHGARARPGAFLILAVSEGTVSPLLLLRAALDGAMDVTWHSPAFSRRLLSDPGGRDDRALSEAGARAAASGCLGQPVAASGGQVTITAFRPLVPGTGVLEPGDQMVAADGRPVRYVEDLFAAAALHRVGEQLVLQARAPDGTTHTAAVPILVNEGTPIPKGSASTPHHCSWRHRRSSPASTSPGSAGAPPAWPRLSAWSTPLGPGRSPMAAE